VRLCCLFGGDHDGGGHDVDCRMEAVALVKQGANSCAAGTKKSDIAKGEIIKPSVFGWALLLIYPTGLGDNHT